MRRFNHAYAVAFSVTSCEADGSDVTPAMVKAGLLARIADLDRTREWNEAVGAPDESYQLEGTP